LFVVPSRVYSEGRAVLCYELAVERYSLQPTACLQAVIACTRMSRVVIGIVCEMHVDNLIFIIIVNE
jgi:hypothetical protein